MTLVAFDRDHWALFFDTSDELADSIEPPSVADDEYVAWDSSGRKLALSVDSRHVITVTSTDEFDLDGLKDALISYLELLKRRNDTLPIPGDLRQLPVDRLFELGRSIE